MSGRIKKVIKLFYFSLGKRVLLKLLSDKYGYSYVEKDLGTVSSLQNFENFLFKAILYAPVLINIRNFSNLK